MKNLQMKPGRKRFRWKKIRHWSQSWFEISVLPFTSWACNLNFEFYFLIDKSENSLHLTVLFSRLNDSVLKVIGKHKFCPEFLVLCCVQKFRPVGHPRAWAGTVPPVWDAGSERQGMSTHPCPPGPRSRGSGQARSKEWQNWDTRGTAAWFHIAPGWEEPQDSGSQNGVPGPAASAWPGSLLECILWAYILLHTYWVKNSEGGAQQLDFN